MLSLLKAGMALNYKISKKWMSRIYVLGNLKNFTSIWTSSYLYWISAAISGWNLTSRTQAIHKFRNSEICLLTLMVISSISRLSGWVTTLQSLGIKGTRFVASMINWNFNALRNEVRSKLWHSQLSTKRSKISNGLNAFTFKGRNGT